VALGAALGACGSNAEPPGAAGTSPAATTATSPQPSTSAGKPKPPTSEPKDRPSVKATPTGSSTAPAWSVVLDLKCARQGADVQGITFQTQPGGPAGFNTIYSDGSNSVDGKSNYTSGFGGGFADAKGVWRMTWTVPANAPLGVATVRTTSQDGSLDVKYTVVAQTGTCPA
ncbi:MAG: hypothetical protein ACRDKG_05625, partial [Actinomycetota bacterium]